MSRWQPIAEQLVRERQGALVAYAYLLTRDRAAAEDLVQDALVRTFAGRARFEHAREAETYVRRAIASTFLDGQRSWARRLRREKTAAVPEGLPTHADAVEADADLAAAMAELPPRERACVALRYLADLSVAETAATLGLSAGSVKRYTYDAIRSLSRRLDVSFDTNELEDSTVTEARS